MGGARECEALRPGLEDPVVSIELEPEFRPGVEPVTGVRGGTGLGFGC